MRRCATELLADEEGFENPAFSPKNINDSLVLYADLYAQSPESSAIRLHPALVNVDLQSIVLAWADLPVDVRYQITALVQAEQWKRQAAQPETGITVK